MRHGVWGIELLAGCSIEERNRQIERNRIGDDVSNPFLVIIFSKSGGSLQIVHEPRQRVSRQDAIRVEEHQPSGTMGCLSSSQVLRSSCRARPSTVGIPADQEPNLHSSLGTELHRVLNLGVGLHLSLSELQGTGRSAGRGMNNQEAFPGCYQSGAQRTDHPGDVLRGQSFSHRYHHRELQPRVEGRWGFFFQWNRAQVLLLSLVLGPSSPAVVFATRNPRHRGTPDGWCPRRIGRHRSAGDALNQFGPSGHSGNEVQEGLHS